MKTKRTIRCLSFIISLVSMALSVYVFLNFTKNEAEDEKSSYKNEQQTESEPSKVYAEPLDNVGAVTFTEDQITELARKMYYCDDFLNNINVEIDDNQIQISARIKDVDKLVEIYPETEKYKSILMPIQNKTIEIKSVLENDGGSAVLKIKSVTVGSIKLDGVIISPFIEEGDFSELFDVDADEISLEKDIVVFKNGVPDILKY